MEAVPLLLSFLALSIVSMDLALSIVWARRAQYKWSWALIAFTASLLGAVVAFALDQSAYLAFTGTARIVLHYVWEGMMVAVSAFILVLLVFAINWMIARPMTTWEKVGAFIAGGLYLGVSIAWFVVKLPIFSLLQYLVWTLTIVYCVFLLLYERKSIKEKSVRTACSTLIIISFALLPVVILAMVFSYFRSFSIPIVCLAYTIAELVFLFTALAHSEKKVKEEHPDFSYEAVNALYHITEREFEVVKLIKKGLTNKEIAAELCISVNTVNNHIANIFSKTDVGSRIDLLNLLQEASW